VYLPLRIFCAPPAWEIIVLKELCFWKSDFSEKCVLWCAERMRLRGRGGLLTRSLGKFICYEICPMTRAVWIAAPSFHHVYFLQQANKHHTLHATLFNFDHVKSLSNRSNLFATAMFLSLWAATQCQGRYLRPMFSYFLHQFVCVPRVL